MELNSDEILIDKILAGDQLAFKKLVENYQMMVINTCNGFLHDKQDAEDIAQEVFVEAFVSLRKFRKESKLSTWLYRIAANKSLNYLRSKKRKHWIQNIEGLLGFNIQVENQLIEKNHPQAVIEMKEDSEFLHQALNSLSENQRIAFTMNKYEDLAYSEIAEIMGVSLSSVESLIHRAKMNLQKKLIHYNEKN